jgi:hypothetical protein
VIAWLGRILKTAVVLDYQNLNTRGAHLFRNSISKSEPTDFVNPFKFAVEAISFRNRFRKGTGKLLLSQVSAYRGLPSPVLDPDENSKNQIQKSLWEQQGKGQLEIVHRDLSYRWEENSHQGLRKRPKNYLSREEKGIDVLCAIAVLRYLQDPQIDAVILASIDSDLEPALEEGLRLAPNKILETLSWHLPAAPGGKNRIGAKLGIWNTGLPEAVYRRVLD